MSEEEHVKLLENTAADPLERRTAAAALTGSSDPRAWEALRRATQDPQWLVRAEAIRALRDRGFEVSESQANFVWAAHPAVEGSELAARLARAAPRGVRQVEG